MSIAFVIGLIFAALGWHLTTNADSRNANDYMAESLAGLGGLVLLIVGALIMLVSGVWVLATGGLS